MSDVVLVTGATGFVGRRLVAALVDRGERVRVAVRTPQTGLTGVDAAVVGDIHGHTDWGRALDGVDRVFHLAARTHVLDDPAADPLREYRRINTEGTARLATAAARSGVRRFVYLSSIKVNGENTDAGPYTAASVPQPEDAYGQTKWEAERALRGVEKHLGMEAVVLRPPLVYGPGVKANFLKLVDLVARGVPLPLGAVHNRRSLVYVENLVDALIVAGSHAAAAGGTFLVSDGEDVSTPQLVRALATALGVRPRLLPLPPVLLRTAGRLLGREAQVKRLTGSLHLDSQVIRDVLGWRPPRTLEDGLAATVAWYRATHHH